MKRYIKPKSEQELIDLFKKIALEEFNYICDVPVEINTRLYSSLGRYKFKRDKEKLKTITVGFDFHPKLLDKHYPLDKIIDTMKHELVHWYTNDVQNTKGGHGVLFVMNCEKFGVECERYKKRERLNKDSYYEARCCGCEKVVAKSKNITNLKRFMDRCFGTVCSCGDGKRYILDKGNKLIYNHGAVNYYGYIREEEWLDETAEVYTVILCKE